VTNLDHFNPCSLFKFLRKLPLFEG